MKNCLLLLAVVAALVVGGPAYSQYVFLDVNGDGVNSKTNPALPDDILGPSVTAVDVYFVTDKNRAGATVTCAADPTRPMTLFSYDVTLHSSGSGTVAFNSWTDALGFATSFTNGSCPGADFCPASPTSSPDIWVGRGGTPPGSTGKIKIGTIHITVTGSPVLDIVTGSSINASAQTAFGSLCFGNQADGTIRLGDDFFDADGTEASTPVVETTWGKIKALYH
jgi:hypothetical protein